MSATETPLEEVKTFLREEFTRIRKSFDAVKPGDECSMSEELALSLSMQVVEAANLARLASTRSHSKPYYNALRWAYASRFPTDPLGGHCRCERCRRRRRQDFDRSRPVLAKAILKAFWKWDSKFFQELGKAMEAVQKDDHHLEYSYSYCDYEPLKGKEHLQHIANAFFFFALEHLRLPTVQEWREASNDLVWRQCDGEDVHPQQWSRAFELFQMNCLQKGEESRGRPIENIGESPSAY